MGFIGGSWCSAQASDTTGGAASTATVTVLAPNTASRKSGVQSMTVTGTGFASGDVIYAGYEPVATTFVDSTHLSTTKFNPMPDNGAVGNIPVGVRKPGQRLSATINFSATT